MPKIQWSSKMKEHGKGRRMFSHKIFFLYFHWFLSFVLSDVRRQFYLQLRQDIRRRCLLVPYYLRPRLFALMMQGGATTLEPLHYFISLTAVDGIMLMNVYEQTYNNSWFINKI